MPWKGTTRVTDEQRRKVAMGRSRGKTDKEIAKDAKLSPKSIHRVVHDRRTQTLILDLKRKDEQKFARIWTKMLDGMNTDITSKVFNERAVTRAQFIRVLTAGDPPLHRVGDVSGAGGDFTLEELVMSMRELRESA
jgi:hypothetical protein